MDVVMQLILALTIACAIPAVLGVIEVALAWYERRTAYRGLPAPPRTARERADEYARNQAAWKGLR